MDPGAVSLCLQNMTKIEELLIARACPIMTVYHKHGGQLAGFHPVGGTGGKLPPP